MNEFKKLALVSAIAALPVSGMAMQSLDDAALSGVTGQDGININIGLNNLTTNLFIEDTDGSGLTGTGSVYVSTVASYVSTGLTAHPTVPGYVDNAHDYDFGGAGFLAIQNVSLSTGTGGIDISIDSAHDSEKAEPGGVLVVGVEIDQLTIAGNGGDPISIGVAPSDIDTGEERDAVAGLERLPGTPGAGAVTEVMSLSGLTLNDLDLGIQLGPDAQNFLSIATSNGLDISMDDFVIHDRSLAGGGGLYVDQLRIENVRLDGTTASITNDGLELTLGTTAGQTVSIAQMGVAIGELTGAGLPAAGTAPLGNVYITGLQLGGTTLTISGK